MKRLYSHLLLLLVVGCAASSSRKPIVLVPGDGGSQLFASLDKPSVVHYFCDKKTSTPFSLWLNLALLVPFVVDCWADNMRLVYDSEMRMTRDSPGVNISVPAFGNTTAIEFVDPSQVSVSSYFHALVEDLVQTRGYTRGVDIRGAPYDFRRAPNEMTTNFFVKLKDLIEETKRINDGQRVTIICHSLGCPTLFNFLSRQNRQWKELFVDQLVTLAAPWGGAVKALKAFASGDNLGVIVVPALTIRKDERTFPSLAFLLPRSEFWPRGEPLVRVGETEYTASDYQAFFSAINYTTGYEMWSDVSGLAFPPANITTHCLHGYGINTMELLKYKSVDNFPDHAPDVDFGDGDGTVNTVSLRGCLRWQQQAPVHYQNFSGVDHMGIMTRPEPIEYIKSIV